MRLSAITLEPSTTSNNTTAAARIEKACRRLPKVVTPWAGTPAHLATALEANGRQALTLSWRRPGRLRRLSEDGPINSFLWAAVAFLTFAVVLFTALWIDASRGVHSDDWRGAVDGATLFALCAGIAVVLGVIGLVVKFW